MTTVRIPIEYDKDNNNVTPSLQEFLSHGSATKPKPTIGNSLDDDIQCIGLITNDKLTAENIMKIKRDHWSSEAAHHILDVTFREDLSNAREAKFNASLLRKLAYNLVKLSVANSYVSHAERSTPCDMIKLTNSKMLKKLFFGQFRMLHIESK